MNKIKKGAIIGGAVVGGVIGGTISVIGHMAKSKFVEGLGESIVDSTILTGQIAGSAVSGAAQVVSGGLRGRAKDVSEGKQDLLNAGGQVVGNFVSNAKTVIDNSGEIVEGVKTGDGRKILNGAKTLGKIAAIGAITVGAIKLAPEKEEKGGKSAKPDEKAD